MLEQVADGVLLHQSEFCQSNAVVVQGQAGVLLIDAGILESELAGIADDLRERGQDVVAGFSTHPHWDHLLWHPKLGTPPRFGTARCAAAIQARLSDPHFNDFVRTMIPADIAAQVPLELLGRITGVPAGATHIPWDGPKIRIIEHHAHAPGHAALLIEEHRILVAGDMLSDVLVPILGMAADPMSDYLAGLQLLEDVADDVDVVIPGHGSVATGDQLLARIAQDRSYVQALHDGGAVDDRRIGPSATYDWVDEVHAGQRQRFSNRR